MAHRSAALWLSLTVLPWPLACTTAQAFTCDAHAQCVKADGAAGRCEAEGVCSFPDAACPSGHRYGALAGELAGECVGGGTSDATTPGPATDEPTTAATEADGASSEPGVTTTEASETEATEPGTTTAGDLGPYGHCSDASDCAQAGSTCLPGREIVVCAPPCGDDDECPLIEGSSTQAVCTTIDMDAMDCVIFCTEAVECPAGMQCGLFMQVGVGFCGWPP